MPRVKVSVGEELMFGPHAPIIRRLSDAVAALQEARLIAQAYLSESRQMDDTYGEHERREATVVQDRTKAWEHPDRHGNPAWVQLFDGENASYTVSENTAAWLEAFTSLWQLEDTVERTHRYMGIEGAQRNSRERERYASKPTLNGLLLDV
jgi:hypothetical protein